MLGSSRISNSSKLSCMLSLPASMKRTRLKTAKKKWRHHFSHYKPMGIFSDFQGQLTLQWVVQSSRNLTRPSSHACHHCLQVLKGSDEKQPRKSGDTVFPIITLCNHGNQWLDLAEFQTHPSSHECYHYLQL